MANIFDKEYATYMEETLQSMMEFPVESICIAVKMKDGGIMTHFFRAKMMDKLLYAGVIQQEAMTDLLMANGWIPDNRSGSEPEED